jgi:DNA-binding LacI/PurR family transcriptional regulator
VTTVSNVLNDHVEAMSPTTLARVRDLMASLNYQPSAIARSLVSGRSAVVALLLQPLPSALTCDDVAALQNRLRSAGRELVLLPEGEGALGFASCEAAIVAGSLQSRRGAGIQSILQTAGKVVIVGAIPPSGGQFGVSLGVDLGVLAAVSHLAEQGHAGVGWLACAYGNTLGADMREAFAGALQRQGVETNARWCEPAAGRDRESVRRWARELMSLRFRPTAVIAEDDALAALLMREVQPAGLRVPGDLAVVGFGDQPWCNWLAPRLTSVSIPFAAGLHRAADLVIGHPAIEGDQGRAELSCELVARDSSGPPRRGAQGARPADTSQAALW